MALALCVVGCGEDLGNKQAVSGMIKVKGEPLIDGTIEFIPLNEQNGATKAAAMIDKGAFKLERRDGLIPAKYRVIITSPEGSTPIDPNVPPGPTGNFVSKDRVPPEYNVNSDKDVEVVSGKENVFNFDIP